jgi:4-carboxymuconolactone decarboxylase
LSRAALAASSWLLPPGAAPLNQAVENQRSTTVEQNFGAISPGLVKFTTQPLFLDLWQRPG